MEELKWYGWKDIFVGSLLIGEEIEKGEGIWKKEYRYIKTPCGKGYDNYCFLLSEKLVHYSVGENKWWFSICHDMNIELFYDPECREEGKRYKRYKMTGYELFETIFADYEVCFAKESEERMKKAQTAKEKRDSKNIGEIVCGVYWGNYYPDDDFRYMRESLPKVYFRSKNGRYSNFKFSKVENVKVKFVLFENISKKDFLRIEDIANAYLASYARYEEAKNSFLGDEKCLLSVRERDISPRLLDLYDESINECEQKMEIIKKRMMEHLNNVLNSFS